MREAHKVEFEKDVYLKTSISIDAMFNLPPDSVYEELRRSAVKITLDKIAAELKECLDNKLTELISKQNENIALAISRNKKFFESLGL